MRGQVFSKLVRGSSFGKGKMEEVLNIVLSRKQSGWVERRASEKLSHYLREDK
jgi:hypothetical protein